MSLQDLSEILKGGAGSGNFNHPGRPGHIGGSGQGGGGSAVGDPEYIDVSGGIGRQRRDMVLVGMQNRLGRDVIKPGSFEYGGGSTKVTVKKPAAEVEDV